MPGKTVMIDVLTPKQALLFGKVKEKLENKGCRVHVVSREYIELTNVFRLAHIKPVIIGKHGGRMLYNKLVCSLERTIMLSKLMKKLSPDIALSFSSPEAARASFGLNIPHVSVNDSPHSVYVAKLTIPLSRKLLTPRVVGKKAWLKYGIGREDIVTYNSLDPVAWLRDFIPDRRVLKKYDLSKGWYIVYRPEEYGASYLMSEKCLTLEKVSKAYSREASLRGLKLVIVPRYEAGSYRRFFRNNNVVILDHGEDTRSILFYSRCFIGAGGTMNAEAMLMGVPTASLYPSSTIVEEFLMKKGLVKVKDEKILRQWLRSNASTDFNEERRLLFLKRIRKMEDPAERIVETCLRLS